MHGKLPAQHDSNDREFIDRFENAAGQGISVDELEAVLSNKGFANYELIEGDVTDTIREYLDRHPPS